MSSVLVVATDRRECPLEVTVHYGHDIADILQIA